MARTKPDELLATLRGRFETHPGRHEGVTWDELHERLQASCGARRVIERMEATGGEPDVIGRDDSGRLLICDCAAETPSGRRSLCYDRIAWEGRRANRPAGNAIDTAREIGVELLSEEDYRRLQEVGEFDRRTSSWLATPDEVRALGGALFGDRRYGRVFVYHNGADSYFVVRGFRGLLRL